ncbi:MAG: hypothetical protein WC943_13370 [Elusimicrobiota bacterium]
MRIFGKDYELRSLQELAFPKRGEPSLSSLDVAGLDEDPAKAHEVLCKMVKAVLIGIEDEVLARLTDQQRLSIFMAANKAASLPDAMAKFFPSGKVS